MTNNPTVFLIMLAAVTFLISLSKGGLGGMAGTLSTPLMALVMPVNQVLGLLLPIMLLADVFSIAFHWKRWNGRLVWLLIPGAVVGVTIGTYFITNVSTQVLKIGLAIIALLFVVYKLLEKRILGSVEIPGDKTGMAGWLVPRQALHRQWPIAACLPSVFISCCMNVTPTVFVATSVLFYAILNWVKVPYYYFTGMFDFQQLWQIAWVFPIVPFGVWIGRWLVTKVSKNILTTSFWFCW